MKIKNISDELLIIAGVKISAGVTKSLDDFGYGFNFSSYEDEFMTAYENDKIQFLEDDDTAIVDINLVSQEFSNLSTTTTTTSYKEEDFYYDYKNLSLSFGESIDVKFTGYLKTLDFYVDSGSMTIQVILPKMNKINVVETNNYVIDTDYKLKDPTIRLTATTASECILYLDGIFYSATKTKDQYLTEIYSYDVFPSSDEIEENSILFKTNFMKTMSGDYFLDIIGAESVKTYNNGTLLNFNRFEDGAYCKFGDVIRLADTPSYTFNMWLHFHGDTTNTQYVMYKKNVLEIYVSSGMLNFYVGKSSKYQIEIGADSWQMFTIAKTGNTHNVYLNTVLVQTFSDDSDYSDNSADTYFGGYRNYYMRSGQIGEVAHYNYHFSSGMVTYLYQNNHPLMQTQTNLIAGSIVNTYSYTSALDLDTSYEFSIMEKETATASNIVSSIKDVDLIGTTIEDRLKVVTAKVYFSDDAMYNFRFVGTNKWCVTINDKVILINQTNSAYYMEEGYYNLRLVCTGDYELQYKLKTDDEYSPIQVFVDDADDDDTVDEFTTYFNVDAQTSYYGATFTNLNVLEFDENNGYIDNLTDDINSGVYNISFNLKHDESNALVFGQGADCWNPNFGLRITNNKLCYTYQDTYIESSTLTQGQWYNIQITADGTTIFIYIDGSLASSKTVTKGWELDSTEPFYIGSMAESYLPSWSSGEFELNNFKWYLKYFSKEEVINNYTNNKVD